MDQRDAAPTYGFPPKSGAASVAPPQQFVARPTPLPKRPKGRWFIGLLLLSACGYGGWQVYESFLRYQAYGVVMGRVVQLSPPWDGELTTFHARAGDTVRQGQPLLTMDNAQMRQRLAALSDDLVSAQADLEAESAKLKWQAAFHVDQGTSGQARYYEMWGTYLSEQRALEKLSNELRTAERLYARKAVPALELDRLRNDFLGQKYKLDKLATAMDEAKKYAEVSRVLLARLGDLGDSLAESGQDQLRPKLAKIEALKAERSRLEAYLAKGRIEAPCNGLVVKLHRFAGEHAKTGDLLVSFLEEGSLQVVLYVAQKQSDSFEAGKTLDMVLEPYPQRLRGQIARLGDQLEAPPEQIKRYYAAGQKLLPVHVRPEPEMQRWMALRMESVIKLP